MIKSRYTYYYWVESEELLMYNALRGSSSFIKFLGDDAVIAIRCLDKPDEFIGSKIYEVLKKYGMLISKEMDESLLLTQIAWKRIFYPGLTLIIMPTEDCNFRCSYCYEEHKKGVMSLKTAEAIVKFVKRNITKYTEINVVWFGGEPLMSTDTIDRILYISDALIEICSCARKRYHADMITNGYNLTYDLFEKLLKRKIYSYQVTIDGIAINHDKYRVLEKGEGSHDKIIHNLMEIKEKCKKRYFKIVIRTNITSEMENLLNEHYDEISRKLAEDSRFQFFFRPVGNWGGDCVKDLNDYLYSVDSFRKIYKKVISIQSRERLDFGRFLSFYDNSTCSACYENNYIIGYDGYIYKCSCHFDENNNKIGLLGEDGMMTLDQERVQRWVKRPELKEGCKKCFFAPACLNMACPIYSNKIKLDNNGIDDCPYEKKYIRETFSLLKDYFKTVKLS